MSVEDSNAVNSLPVQQDSVGATQTIAHFGTSLTHLE